MADFAALGAADAARFTGCERRHVVVQHEAVVLFFAKTVNDLFILLRAEGGRDESLRFTAGEERRAVGAREHALADFNRANRAGVAAVDAGFAGENLRADEVGFEFEEDAVHFIGIGRFRAGGGHKPRGAFQCAAAWSGWHRLRGDPCRRFRRYGQ